MRRRAGSGRRRSGWLLCALALDRLILGGTCAAAAAAPRPRLLAAFLDVGAGDCTLIAARTATPP